MQNAQQYASDDIMMICTGSEVKWISTDAYFNLDEVVFVEPPEHAPDITSQVDCTNKSLSDLQGKGALSHSVDAQLLAYHALVSSIEQRPYTAFAYLTAQTRAPPSIIV
jgi:hypothetical protein